MPETDERVEVEREMLESAASALREASPALGRASSALGKLPRHKNDWYACNRLLHGAHDLAQRLEGVSR